MADQNRIKPATAARTPRNRAKLMPTLAKAAANTIMQFGREWPFPHTGAVRLGNTQHKPRSRRPHARPRARIGSNRVGTGYKRIGAVVHVQHDRLRAFEQNPAAIAACIVQNVPCCSHKGQHLGGNIAQERQQFFLGKSWRAKTCQQRVMVQEQFIQLPVQRFRLGQIAQTDGAAGNLVLIGGANATAGGANLAVTTCGLTRTVKRTMHGQDKGNIFRNLQGFGGNLQPLFANTGNFGQQGLRVHHNAIANNAQLAADHTRRQQ